MKFLILPSSFCAPRQSGAHGMCHACHTLDTPLRSTLPSLSLVFFIFEKLLSHEALVMWRVTATRKQPNAVFYVAIKDKNCSSDIGSFDAFRSKFFDKVISYFKSFSLNKYDLRIFSSVFLIEIFDLLGKELKYAKNCFRIITENPYKILSLQHICGKSWNCSYEPLT